MMILAFVYVVAVLVTVVSAIDAGILIAASGLIGPLLSFFAGSGTRGMFFHGRYLFGVILGFIVCALGISAVEYTGFWVQIFSTSLLGWQWCLVGFLCGFLSTSRSMAEVDEGQDQPEP